MSTIVGVMSKGSQTAKRGFQNEEEIAGKFNNWRVDVDAQKWIEVMGYDISDIQDVNAVVLSGYKTDVQVQVTIYLKQAIDVRNLQVKLVSNHNGFNQIDKRWIARYNELWDIPSEIVCILKKYTGETPPSILNPRDVRRTFADELSLNEQELLLSWIKNNQIMIVSDILKGRGEFAAEWMLVAQKVSSNARWTLKPMNYCLNYFGNGTVVITPKGNIRIGRITMQRKGGDNGRKSANMLQFKINPAELFAVDDV